MTLFVMNLKVIGYGLSAVGLLLLVIGAGDFGIPVISMVPKTLMNIISMVVLAAGVVAIIVDGGSGGGGGKSRGYQGKRKSKSKGKIEDLPVYEGDNIIAYRRD